MTISGNILIDKIRISVPIHNFIALNLDLETKKLEISKILSKYYPKNAYNVGISRGRLRITLTPTRFNPPNILNYTDTNLEMPTELWLYNLFSELGFENRRLSEFANITLIHLTKNIITDNPVLDYITFLSTYPFANGFESAFIYSSHNNKTLRIATQKRNKEKDDINGLRNFIFYDKVREIRDKTHLEYIYPKEHLTSAERRVLIEHSVFYNREMNRLSLNGLNLLRCELQYRYKDKIKPLAQALNNSEEESLTVASLMDLLKQGQLYSKLNEFYNSQLKKNIFYCSLDNKQSKMNNSYQKAFEDLLFNNNILELKSIYKACGFSSKFQENLKRAYSTNLNRLYIELYHKFGFT